MIETLPPLGVLLVDCDGTIRKTRSGQTFINIPDDQQLILEAACAMHRWQAKGWMFWGVSNQMGVQAEHKTIEDAIAEQSKTMALARTAHINLVGISICPDDGNQLHVVDSNGEVKVCTSPQKIYRKPEPGMLQDAVTRLCRAHGGRKLVFAMTGDRPEDEGAAEAAGIEFIKHTDWWEGKTLDIV